MARLTKYLSSTGAKDLPGEPGHHALGGLDANITKSYAEITSATAIKEMKKSSEFEFRKESGCTYESGWDLDERLAEMHQNVKEHKTKLGNNHINKPSAPPENQPRLEKTDISNHDNDYEITVNEPTSNNDSKINNHISESEISSASTPASSFTSKLVIDASLPLHHQRWYHGSISRFQAESLLADLPNGSFLVRESESMSNAYSLSLKHEDMAIHLRIELRPEDGQYIMGEFGSPFPSVSRLVQNYTERKMKIHNAGHCILRRAVDRR